jgi:hypothetical protein
MLRTLDPRVVDDEPEEFEGRERYHERRAETDEAKRPGPHARFSGACHNGGEHLKDGLEPPGSESPLCDGKVRVKNRNPRKPGGYIRRSSGGRRLAGERGGKFGLAPVPADKLGAWRDELALEGPKPGGAIPLHEAGYFQSDDALPYEGLYAQALDGPPCPQVIIVPKVDWVLVFEKMGREWRWTRQSKQSVFGWAGRS